MRITESQLRKIVREEIIKESVYNPSGGKKLTPAQTGRFKRSAVVESTLRSSLGIIAAIGDIHPQLLDETHVRYVLGLRPLSINEGRIDEAHLRRLLHEQLLYESWWSSAKTFLDMGIDKIKDKADSVADAVKTFGENTKGVVAALWMAASDDDLLEKLSAAARSLLSKTIRFTFDKPLHKIAEKFRGISDIPKKIVEKISGYFSKLQAVLAAPSGWKGLLTSMAAYLGCQWALEEFGNLIKELKESVLDHVGDLSKEIAKKLGDKLTDGLITKLQEKFESIITSLSAAALEQIAGPLAWIKQAGKILGGVDWVTKNLIGVIRRGSFRVGSGGN